MPLNLQNEDSILRKIVDSFRSSQAARAGRSVSLGIGDDAALFRPKPGHETILTCDWFLEGTHFLRQKHPPEAVGWKCLARAVSDVAAMGAAPRCFLLSLALPETHTGQWLELFLGGLRRAAHKFQCALAGGDTTRRNEILINVTVVGEVRTGLAVPRSGAREGDLLYVSGTLGEAELGLQLVLREKSFASRKNSLLKIDLSDGLSSDLSRLCAASAVGALLEKSKIPKAQIPKVAFKHGHDPLQLALHGGDDYELLFTVRAQNAKLLPKIFKRVGLTAIGRITRGRKLLLLEEDGHVSQLVPRGWDPFREKL